MSNDPVFTDRRVEILPCGCVSVYHGDAGGRQYTHFCKPTCRFDATKPGGAVAKGYHYVGWEYKSPVDGTTVAEALQE